MYPDRDGKPETIYGVIYTPDNNVGIKKLLEIKQSKEDLGIKCIEYQYCERLNNRTFAKFENGDTWKVVNSNNLASIRGVKWDRAYIDVYNITIRQKEEIMFNSGMYRFEPQYFNYDNEYSKKDGDE